MPFHSTLAETGFFLINIVKSLHETKSFKNLLHLLEGLVSFIYDKNLQVGKFILSWMKQLSHKP